MSRRKVNNFLPNLVELERREVPAASAVKLAGGVLAVRCNNTSSTIVVTQTNNSVSIKDVLLNKNWTYRANQISRIDVFGGTGNDTLTARTDTVLVRLSGGNGKDTLLGGNNGDILIGGSNNDIIRGGGGDDYAAGGDGNDYIYGDDGNDDLNGGNGNDQIDGGAGADGLAGDDGKDILISLDDDTADVIDGGRSVDIFWMDQGDRLVSPSGDVINAITAFSNAGADRTINGDRIPDPTPLPGDQMEVMVGKPLFSSQGPGYEDLAQGALGDCWLLAGLGTTARSYPDIIRQRVVDFGDGTYGVKLGDQFYRVDNDLPVAHSGNTVLQYTAFGREGSIWVAIFEKAYTHYRAAFQPTYGNTNPVNTYGSIEGGFTYDVFGAFDLNASRLWFGTAAPSAAYGLNTTAQQLSNTIRMVVDNGLAAALQFQTVPAGAPLISAHQYILLGYTMDPATGLVASVTLRNPWGIDGPSTVPGPGNDNNFDDGLVTVTVSYQDTAGEIQPGTLMNCWAGLEWGTPKA